LRDNAEYHNKNKVMAARDTKGESQSMVRLSLGNYVLTIVLSVAIGAGVTLLITSQRSNSDRHPPFSSAPAKVPDAAPDVSGLSAGEAAHVRANSAYDHQRWPEAISEYQQAIARGVDTADVHTDLGNAFRFSGQPERALEQYQIAQRLNPQHENSLFNQIGLFVETLHQPGYAIPICQEFIRRFPASDKLPAVQEQLARIKNPPPVNPATDAQDRAALSQWLKDQSKKP
jgi:tetratricopeptide (TPR) repeat protein